MQRTFEGEAVAQMWFSEVPRSKRLLIAITSSIAIQRGLLMWSLGQMIQDDLVGHEQVFDEIVDLRRI